MQIGWRAVVGVVIGSILGAGCAGDDGHGPKGVVELQATAFNAGTAAQAPRLAEPALPPAPVATHTIDPASFRVHAFISGPTLELKVTIKRIIASDGADKNVLLFGNEDGSGPGVEITLTNGVVDLAAAGLHLNPIPVGHYNRINIWPSRAVKMKGCVTGTFNAQTAMSGTYNGVTYTTDAVSAGPHQFCTIAAKSLLNFENGTAMPSGPVGTDAEFEAQTTPEELEVDIGEGGPLMTGYPSSAADVRNAVGNLDVMSDFDVDETTPVKLTLVVDMNRMLRFWPNTNIVASAPSFQPPRPQGYPAGTSYFYTNDFNQSLGLFEGAAGSVEGYQVTSEICQDLGCVPGGAPDSLSREWMTVIRDGSGAVVGGLIAPDDVPPAIIGDLVPTLTTAGTTPGTVRLSVGLYRLTAQEHGYIDGFVFKNVGDPEDSCTVYPVMGNGPVDGHGPFPFWYTRKL